MYILYILYDLYDLYDNYSLLFRRLYEFEVFGFEENQAYGVLLASGVLLYIDRINSRHTRRGHISLRPHMKANTFPLPKTSLPIARYEQGYANCEPQVVPMFIFGSIAHVFWLSRLRYVVHPKEAHVGVETIKSQCSSSENSA